MTVRARFRLSKVETAFGSPGAKLTFAAMYDDKIAEDIRFMKATPWGEFSQQIDNPGALKYFQKEDGSWRLGDYFYLDVSDAPPY